MKITVLRDKKKQDFMVTIGDRQDVVNTSLGLEKHGEAAPGKGEVAPAKFGVQISTPTQARKEALGYKEKGGVVIEEIEPGSFAEDIGLLKGDMIVSINRLPVNDGRRRNPDLGRLEAGRPGRVPCDAVRFALPGRRNGNQLSRAPEWKSIFAAGAMPNNK